MIQYKHLLQRRHLFCLFFLATICFFSFIISTTAQTSSSYIWLCNLTSSGASPQSCSSLSTCEWSATCFSQLLDVAVDLSNCDTDNLPICNPIWECYGTTSDEYETCDEWNLTTISPSYSFQLDPSSSQSYIITQWIRGVTCTLNTTNYDLDTDLFNADGQLESDSGCINQLLTQGDVQPAIEYTTNTTVDESDCVWTCSLENNSTTFSMPTTWDSDTYSQFCSGTTQDTISCVCVITFSTTDPNNSLVSLTVQNQAYAAQNTTCPLVTFACFESTPSALTEQLASSTINNTAQCSSLPSCPQCIVEDLFPLTTLPQIGNVSYNVHCLIGSDDIDWNSLTTSELSLCTSLSNNYFESFYQQENMPLFTTSNCSLSAIDCDYYVCKYGSYSTSLQHCIISETWFSTTSSSARCTPIPISEPSDGYITPSFATTTAANWSVEGIVYCYHSSSNSYDLDLTNCQNNAGMATLPITDGEIDPVSCYNSSSLPTFSWYVASDAAGTTITSSAALSGNSNTLVTTPGQYLIFTWDNIPSQSSQFTALPWYVQFMLFNTTSQSVVENTPLAQFYFSSLSSTSSQLIYADLFPANTTYVIRASLGDYTWIGTSDSNSDTELIALYELPCDVRGESCVHGECSMPSSGSSLSPSPASEWYCYCNSNWTGSTCDEPDCSTSLSNCSNHGSCIVNSEDDTIPSCNCTDDWIGDDCSVINCPLLMNNCTNNGICIIDNTTDVVSCQCNDDIYSGDFCEINACQNITCAANQGQCVWNSTTLTAECQCVYPFSGTDCTYNYICDDITCENGGSCEISSTNASDASCQCISPFTGTLCQNNSLCDALSCENGGWCDYDSSDQSASCACPTPFSGDSCETNTQCQALDCLNGGTCIWDNTTLTATCSCPEFYSGVDCEVNSSPCANITCSNGGTCSWDSTTYEPSCSCVAPYSGTTCSELPCDLLQCENGGTCEMDSTTYVASCQCVAPYSGTTCSYHPTCDDIVCEHGTCFIDNSTASPACNCDDFYSGSDCSINACDSLSCLNNGTCAWNSALDVAYCDCQIPYFGASCQNDACDILNCTHGDCELVNSNQTTAITDEGDMQCVCDSFWSDASCSTCAGNSTCNDHGYAYIDSSDDCSCSCTLQYSGAACSCYAVYIPCIFGHALAISNSSSPAATLQAWLAEFVIELGAAAGISPKLMWVAQSDMFFGIVNGSFRVIIGTQACGDSTETASSIVQALVTQGLSIAADEIPMASQNTHNIVEYNDDVIDDNSDEFGRYISHSTPFSSDSQSPHTVPESSPSSSATKNPTPSELFTPLQAPYTRAAVTQRWKDYNATRRGSFNISSAVNAGGLVALGAVYDPFCTTCSNPFVTDQAQLSSVKTNESLGSAFIVIIVILSVVVVCIFLFGGLALLSLSHRHQNQRQPLPTQYYDHHAMMLATKHLYGSDTNMFQ